MSRGLLLEGQAATRRLGALLGSLLRAGDVIGLEGDLGAGKTFLAQQMIWAMGVDEDEPVTSPTFALMQEYDGRAPILHADFYRLNTPTELIELGLEERLSAPWIAILEWARKHSDAIKPTMWLTLEVRGETKRFAHLEPNDARGEALVAEIERRW